MRVLAGLLTTAWCMTSPAYAQQSWLPVVSSAQAASSGPDLEQGWFPVVINPPALDEVVPQAAPPPAIVAQAKKAPVAEQRQVQRVVQPPPPQAPPPPSETARKSVEAPQEKTGPAQDYCVSIADAAADARFAWQKQTLGEMEKELERRIAILETRTAEYREWLARRDAFVEKAQHSLVRIFARMRPDAAASQLAAMDEETAAAVLTKLDPRNASAILNEMPPGSAARLTSTIAGAAKVDNADENSAPAPGGGRS